MKKYIKILAELIHFMYSDLCRLGLFVYSVLYSFIIFVYSKIIIYIRKRGMRKTKCQPCQGLDKMYYAISWCIQCKEPLCIVCEKHHKVQKMTKDHSFITIAQYETVSNILSSIPTKCENHKKEKLFYFCWTHNLVYCKLCKFNEHKNCITMEKHNMQESEKSFLKMKKTLLMAESVHEKRKENIERLDKARDLFHLKVKDKKRQIDKLLNDTNKAIEQFEREHFTKRQELECEKKEIIDIIKNLEQRVDNFNSLLQLASIGDSRVVLAEMMLDKQNDDDYTKTNKSLENLSDIDCKFHILLKTDAQNQGVKLDCNISFISNQCSKNTEISDIFDGDSSAVEYDAELLSPNVDDSSCMTNVAQAVKIETSDKFNSITTIMQQSNQVKFRGHLEREFFTPKSENILPSPNNLGNTTFTKTVRSQAEEQTVHLLKNQDKKFTLKSRFPVDKNSKYYFRCVQILPKGHIIVGQGPDPKLTIFERQGIKKGEIKLQHVAEAITVVDDITIAATVGQSVLIIDVQDYSAMRIVRGFSFCDYCYGIAYVKNKKLLVNCENEGLHLVTLKEELIHTYYFITGVLNICLNNENYIVSTKRNSEFVHYKNLVSNRHYQKCCPKLFGATGITVDDKGTIFVSCNKSDKIYMLKNGSYSGISILSREDGIDKPCSIAYDKTNNEIILINNNGDTVCFYEKE